MFEITSASEYEVEVMESMIPVVIDFWAPWCGPCRAFAPIFEEASKQFDGRVKFVKINIENDPKFSQQLAAEFEIRGIPTFAIVTNGMLVDKLVGAGSKDHFTKWLEANI